MTLCLAAICKRESEIVMIGDTMLSNDYWSADAGALKLDPVGHTGRWTAMFAGDPSTKRAVVSRANDLLAERKDESVGHVAGAMQQAFYETRYSLADVKVLHPMGLSRADFLHHGREWLGEQEFAQLLSQIRAADLETEFLVGGCDRGDPYLFSIEDPGVWRSREDPGFHAIGTGWIRAVSALYTTYNPSLSLPELVYRLCEAKFLGESAPTVGPSTIVLRRKRDGTCEFLRPEHVAQIRAVWVAQGRPKIPKRARDIIADALVNGLPITLPRP